MEFKLNKIDTDIIKKLQNETKENKVHSAKNINLKKDIIKYKEQYNDKEKNSRDEKQIEENIDKKYITIDVIKDNEEYVQVRAEKLEKVNEENSKGIIINTKK